MCCVVLWTASAVLRCVVMRNVFPTGCLIKQMTQFSTNENSLSVYLLCVKVIDEKLKERQNLPQSSRQENSVDDVYGRRKKKLAFLDLLVENYNEQKIDREGIREEVDTFMFEVLRLSTQ